MFVNEKFCCEIFELLYNELEGQIRIRGGHKLDLLTQIGSTFKDKERVFIKLKQLIKLSNL